MAFFDIVLSSEQTLSFIEKSKIKGYSRGKKIQGLLSAIYYAQPIAPLGLVINPYDRAVTGSNISLLDLMIDSYEMKMISWPEKYAYSEEGSGIDVRPKELNMQQSQLHLDDYDGLLEQSIKGASWMRLVASLKKIEWLLMS